MSFNGVRQLLLIPQDAGQNFRLRILDELVYLLGNAAWVTRIAIGIQNKHALVHIFSQNTLSFFCPHQSGLTIAVTGLFSTSVKLIHAAVDALYGPLHGSLGRQVDGRFHL